MGLISPGIIDGGQDRVRGLRLGLSINGHEVEIRALLEANMKCPELDEIRDVAAGLSDRVQGYFKNMNSIVSLVTNQSVAIGHRRPSGPVDSIGSSPMDTWLWAGLDSITNTGRRGRDFLI